MNITSLLNRIQDINKKYEQFAKLSGENFNVFSVLGLGSAEVMHSQFIAELLNPNGSHGQGFIYLKLFLSQIGLIDIFSELQITKIVTEKHTGEIDKDYNEGGRIDIYIEHPDRNIIIENKIFAADQLNQLYRYHQFDKKACILYLSLEGSRPSNESLGSLDINNVKCLSYQTDIVNWLNTCIEKSSSLPLIRETLVQYRNIVKEITNQCSSKDKEMEINDTLLSSEDNFKAAIQLTEAMLTLRKLPDVIFNMIRESFKHKYGAASFKLCVFDEVYSINLQVVYESYDKHFQLGVVPLKDDKWPHQGHKWKDKDKFCKLFQITHKFLEKIYKEQNYKKIKGYYSGTNYLCCIPFEKIIEQEFSFKNPNFKDYKWLSNSGNQQRLIDYSLNLCEEFIHFMKENAKDMDITFLV